MPQRLIILLCATIAPHDSGGAGIRLRVALFLAFAIAAIVLVACGGSESDPPPPLTPYEATLSSGEVVGLVGEALCPKNPSFASGTLSASFISDTGNWRVVDDLDAVFTVVEDGGQVIADNEAAREMLSNYGSFTLCTE